MKNAIHSIDPDLQQQLIDYTYDIVGSIQYVYQSIGNGLPEYIYQEALAKHLKSKGYSVHKEYMHHPIFMDEALESYIKMDLMIEMPRGNIIIECKAIPKITSKEQYQTFGYLRGTRFPIALLANFGTYPKAEIQRYYFKDDLIQAF